MGTLLLRRLPVDCIIGVHPHERGSRQRLMVNVALETDFSRAAAGDALEEALDYTVLANSIETFARTGRFQLIETLAERLADELFDDKSLCRHVTRLEIEVWKPAALPGIRQVGVRTIRSRTAPDARPGKNESKGKG